VVAPIIAAIHVSKGGRHTALRGNRMAAVGNTLVTKAVFSPDAAIPSAARNPAPPAPTMTTS